MSTAEKLILIDGNSLANRAFYALPPFSTAEGVFTNAVYGFLNMLLRLLDEERPEYVVVAFDKGGGTFRDAIYDAYKATRQASPPEFRPQLALLREVMAALNIHYVEASGFEADDLLGTLARLASEQGLVTDIITGDRDALQLVDDRVTVCLTRKGISELARFDPAAVEVAYGIAPPQVVDLKALMGDSSDNIPGVPGVGEKTAAKLLQQFGSLDALLQRLDDVNGKKLQETLRAHVGDAVLSRKLATIDCHAPVELDLNACRVQPPDYAVALPLFRRLEFKTLLGRVTPPATHGGQGATDTQGAAAASATPAGGSVAAAAVEVQRVETPAAAARLAGELPPEVTLVAQVAAVTAGAAGDGGRARPCGVALAADAPGADQPPRCWWVDGSALPAMDPYWGRCQNLNGHDLKPLLVWLRRRGVPVVEPAFDTALAAYLLDPSRSTYHLADLARQFGLGEIPTGQGPEDLSGQSAAALALRGPMTAALREAGLWPLFAEVELPLVPILAELEASGVAVDGAQLVSIGRDLDQRIQHITAEIFGAVGYDFNLNSPRQLGDVLFAKLGLPVIKRTKTGPSTDADVLEELAALNPVVARILDYRTLVKLKGTYVDGLHGLIEGDGKIHTTFNQTVAATGRLSSTDPNLQNIPIRLEEGRRLRRVFVPGRPGWLLVAADYSQIELRIVAHYSGDRSLLQAFRQDEDIHTRTAAEVFGVRVDAVTKEQRRAAKAVNFGLIYGQSDFGLARAIGIGRAEAKDFIQRYFSLYPGVKSYMEAKVAEARQTGCVTTLMGRRRFLPEINHRIFNQRQRAEREAINTPIQGTAADLMKVAMVRVHRAMRAVRLSAQMLLQVHDELVFEAPAEEVATLRDLAVREMEGAMALDVPLKVDVRVGRDWYGMQGVAEWLGGFQGGEAIA